MKNMSCSGNTHAHFVQAHICIGRRKFKTVIPSLGDTLTLMQECFKNIRDVDKKIRLLEFYVFGNVTVNLVGRALIAGMLTSSLLLHEIKCPTCMQKLSPFCLLINKCGQSIAASEV